MSPMCLHTPLSHFTPLNGHLIKGFAIFLKTIFVWDAQYLKDMTEVKANFEVDMSWHFLIRFPWGDIDKTRIFQKVKLLKCSFLRPPTTSAHSHCAVVTLVGLSVLSSSEAASWMQDSSKSLCREKQTWQITRLLRNLKQKHL